MLNLKTLFAGSALAIASLGAMAQATTATPGVDQRQANQEKRIDNGIASGELNKKETRRLTHEQAAVDKAENHAKADGTVTPQERHHLHRMQKHASRDIHRQKHDAQTAPAAVKP